MKTQIFNHNFKKILEINWENILDFLITRMKKFIKKILFKF